MIGLVIPGYGGLTEITGLLTTSLHSQAILFSHPADFTPVCTTELGEVARRGDDFAKRNVKVIGISANGLQDHHRWVQDINDYGSKFAPTNVNFPIVRVPTLFQDSRFTSSMHHQIADEDRKISTIYDMLDEQDATNRDAKGLPFTASVVHCRIYNVCSQGSIP